MGNPQIWRDKNWLGLPWGRLPGRRSVAAFTAGVVVGMGVLAAIGWAAGGATLLNSFEATAETMQEIPQGNPPSHFAGFPLAQSTPLHDSDSPGQFGISSILKQVKPAVVRVSTKSVPGSGVIIDTRGTVLTSAHILNDDQFATVFIEGREPLVGTVSRLDQARDLALVELPPGVYPSAELGTESNLLLGAPVYALGYPLNMAGAATVTMGIISRRLDEPELGRQVIQTDAAINIGNSGGPIVDATGRVIGITTSILGDYPSRRTVGISFAVSITTIRDHFLDDTPQPVSELTISNR